MAIELSEDFIESQILSQLKSLENLEECSELFSEAERKKRVHESRSELPIYSGIKYAEIEESRIPRRFLEIFRIKNIRPTSFGVARQEGYMRGRDIMRSRYKLGLYFIFVPDTFPMEFHDQKSVHEYYDLVFDNCMLATLHEFKSACLKGREFAKKYSDMWLERYGDWLKTRATKEQKELFNYLPSSVSEIFRKGGYLL
jgi:hypothetical protein